MSCAAARPGPAYGVMPTKRVAYDAEDEEDEVTSREETKKLRTAVDKMADEWVCPITHELPLDPVMAADGQVYERSAIQEYIAACEQQRRDLRSPMTNQYMGRQLTASAQVRSTIEMLVRTDAISGDKADRWKLRFEVDEMRHKAEAGDAKAMFELGHGYDFGKMGLTQKKATAFSWYTKGAATVEGTQYQVACLAKVAVMLIGGHGVTKNVAKGLCLLTEAAKDGSDLSAKELGDAYDHAWYGLGRDRALAKKWYVKVATCWNHLLSNKERQLAAERARAL